MNWGFIGFGRIARKFLESLNAVEGEVPYAFASRSNAAALQNEFPKVKMYDSYESLLADPEVDIVYISTTHNFHCQNTIDALQAGKHVLCEKPMGISSNEIVKMTEVARESGKFLMEAMWMRFLPAYRQAIDVVKSGKIGEVKYMTASFGFRSEEKLTQDGRLLNPDLAGGALYDVGVYPLTIVSDLFGWEPSDFKAHAIKSGTGVDETIQVQLDFGDNRMAQVLGSIALHTNKEACIYGDKGYVRIPMFWKAESFEIIKGDEVETFSAPMISTGYAHEIVEVRDCILKGKTESELFTLNDSLMSARLVERILSTIFK
ncbi:Gfo/Idh/MocA family protein [Roseivirga sp. E12]|uniref:Gfo/Idh/MocA family protein n=1 Tax=Roseivirga sp. E12 TaxID=2819237 RepID=UPI001ABCB9E1|nr:Gfo/Idh/MocA family oxidoreductase [Roseivirga sp. E12]MBO3699503.1 Gfo/Idh/MocA family oxidoreductase [Roseivirga sp. E12]